jgi:O-ureido-D-serine cyclo-ligase
MPDVLIATDSEHADVWEDERPLVDALERRGLRTSLAVWNDPAVDWTTAGIVVVRYVFDYVREREAFCAWADAVEATTPLHNPARVIRWNSHKSYLGDLEEAGVAIVPTTWLPAGAAAELDEVLASRSWDDVVIKPAVDNGARGTLRVTGENRDAGRIHLARLLARGDVMIQPYMDAIEGPGEHKMIHIDGSLSHTIRESPRLGGKDFSMDLIHLIEPEPEERSLAEQVLSAVPESPLLYARIDTVMDDGVARLMELEVIEPVLFFSKGPDAAERMAEAIARRI